MNNDLPTVFPVTSHTHHVGPGSTFVAIKGTKEDGVTYIPQALSKGATTIVVEDMTVVSDEINERIQKCSARLERVVDTRQALAVLSAQAWEYPAKKIKIIGVTGTKGKTTTSFILEHMLRTAGYKTALLSTVKNRIGDTWYGTTLTTQQPDYIHMFLHHCVEQSVDYVVMELSAQAMTQQRVHGLSFEALIFTNFSQEHAEFYATQEDYFAAKEKLFDLLKPDGIGVVNGDDAWTSQIAKKYKNIATYSVGGKADVVACVISSTNGGISFSVVRDNKNYLFSCPTLIGSFNVYNVLGALTCAQRLGIPLQEVAQAVTHFSSVPGRMERYQLSNGAVCVIDYAHNPSSFQALLPTLRSLTNKLIVVFGCGGDRDVTKRSVMGNIAATYADLVILTTDNPRSENPQSIIDQILTGVSADHRNRVVIELDRETAIKMAHAHSDGQTIIALLGKGPDEYQEVRGVKHYFSERAIVQGL